MSSCVNEPAKNLLTISTAELSRQAVDMISELVSALMAERSGVLGGEYQDNLEVVRRRFWRRNIPRQERLRLIAIANVLVDLAKQGWVLNLEAGKVRGCPPDSHTADPRNTRRAQLLSQRLDQLRKPSVQQFVKRMEHVQVAESGKASIFSLMRDGSELAESLQAVAVRSGGVPSFREFTDPYLQFVETDQVCEYTGLKLTDIWRYFRLGWTNPYQSVPGRTMMFLVRDRAVKNHPVMGLGALSSAAVKLKSRDDAIGWESDVVIAEAQRSPRGTRRLIEWAVKCVQEWLEELYRVDLVADGLMPNDLSGADNDECLVKLRQESVKTRKVHQHLMAASENKKSVANGAQSGSQYWIDQAITPLFRSKRCGEFADLLSIRKLLHENTENVSPNRALDNILAKTVGRRALAQVIRRAKARTVGTAIADLTLCGAVPPYGPLLGGKLVAMLATSPEVVKAYDHRYRKSVSVIASSMAGRPICRPAKLAFIGTTSLYGIRPCQYDRVSVPLDRIGGSHGNSLKYEYMSITQGWGTSHFGEETTRSISEYLRSFKDGVQVNYVFGEGANPKLRALREGLAALGFSVEDLLQHGNRKLIYGVRLLDNTAAYLLKMEKRPKYRFSLRKPTDSTVAIVDWWMERWLSGRFKRSDFEQKLRDIEENTLILPITHGARVVLPDEDVEQTYLFE